MYRWCSHTIAFVVLVFVVLVVDRISFVVNTTKICYFVGSNRLLGSVVLLRCSIDGDLADDGGAGGGAIESNAIKANEKLFN